MTTAAPVRRRRLLLTAAIAVLAASVQTAPAADSDSEIVARIDEFIRRGWADNAIEPSPRAGDGEFARRAGLDTLGQIPSYDALVDFLDDASPDKRQRYVDALLDDPAYVRHWTTVWANLLVGRGGNQAARSNRAFLEQWLRNAFYRNLPYDDFASELIAAEGNSTRNGAVGFLASHLNDGARPATSITARVFLGMQVQCTECHNHPFNEWKQDQFWGMNAFFRGTRVVGRDRETNAFTLADEPAAGFVYFERRTGLTQATVRTFVDGTRVPLSADAKPRDQLAALVTSPDQPYLARALVNRMWGHYFGYGFTRPVDDMGPHNPPSHPELLDYLATQFRESGHDLKRLIRWIAASEAYNLTSRFGENNGIDDPATGETPHFSRLYPKLFTAEQLYDSLLIATQADRAGSAGDEAERRRRAWLQQFVQTFGTDENDEATTFNGTIPQAMLMMNGELTRNALSGEPGSFLWRVVESPTGDARTRSGGRRTARRPAAAVGDPRTRRRNIPQKIETLFLVGLARRPTEAEMQALDRIFRESGLDDPISGLQDVFWAVLNSNEFIINH